MPRTERFLLRKKTVDAINSCGIPIAKLAPMFGLHCSQIGKALRGERIGPVLLTRFEALGTALGVDADDIAFPEPDGVAE